MASARLSGDASARSARSDAIVGWAVGPSGFVGMGFVFHTTDGGQTWTAVEPDPDGAWQAVHFADTDHGCLAGEQTIIRTADGGQTWAAVTLAGTWVCAPLLFRLLFGILPTPEQIGWLRGMALSMACLGPVYVVVHYELARDRIRLLLPLCALSTVYVLSAWLRQVSPNDLIRFLLVASVLSLFTAARALAAERDPPAVL